MPLVPSMLALWLLNFGDRFFILKLADQSEVGVYSIGARIASAMVLLLAAFRAGWLAFAYSIEDDDRARRVLVRADVPAVRRLVGGARTGPALALARPVADDTGVLRRLRGRAAARLRRGRARRLQRRVDRPRAEETHAVQLGRHGSGAAVSVVLNLVLIPPYGIVGAGIANLSAFTVMFLVITWWSQRVFWVPYQWRRVVTVVGVPSG